MHNKNSEYHYRAVFLVPPSVHLLDLTGPAHIFYEAKSYGAPIEISYVSLSNESEEKSTAEISLGKLKRFNDFVLGPNDWLIIPGLESELLLNEVFLKEHVQFYEWLLLQHQQKAKICAVCTGAYLLAKAGLLDGKNCTTHWKYLSDFRYRFPDAKLCADRLFVKDQNIYSTAGISSGIDLSLFLLEEQFGSVVASEIAREVVVYLRRTASDPQLSVFLQYRNHIENQVHQVQDLLAQNLNKKFTIEDLAEHAYMSPRNLTRLFKKTTGITIGKYIEKLRVERAMHLLAEGKKMDEVASECGLKSTNQLRSLLNKYKASIH
ncbi:GlxA family transcriptional regulator [Psychroflexus tropicus]|jgi:transcriptional regulator GlxA family with amidase domain|uniref:GlxA family transcriptional regulator n=1 Tax=Psychroflexus tropicus TaxID=197345 RepID=UPI000367C833|nr:AraC family transcriptional regulator [Psychroflexus tropicus]